MPPRARAEGPWHVLKTPRFTVVSQAGERATEAWADEFSVFIELLHQFIPFDERRLTPLTVVIFDRKSEFDPYRPRSADGNPIDVQGYFSRREDWAVIGMCANLDDEELRRIIFHEGVHWCFSTYQTHLPLWFEEGVAEVYSTFHVTRGFAEWGDPIAEHIQLLRIAQPLPLSRLLFLGQEDPLYYQRHRIGMFYAESWAFTHYLLFGRHPGPAHPLDAYLRALRTTRDPDRAFSDAFGANYREVDRRLAEYVATGSYIIGKQRLPPVARVNPPFAAAPPLLVETALAKAALGSGRSALAQSHATAAIAAAPTDPSGFELAALAATESGQDEAVGKFTESAIQLGTQDAETLVLAAGVRYRDQMKQGGILPVAARQIANLCENAIDRNPRLRSAYDSLGKLIGELDAPIEEDGKFLAHGRQVFPDDGFIAAGMAQFEFGRGQRAEALRLVHQALDPVHRLTPAEHAHLRRLADWMGWEIDARQLERLLKERRYAEANALVGTMLSTLSQAGSVEVADLSESELGVSLVAGQDGRGAELASILGTAANDADASHDEIDARRLIQQLLQIQHLQPEYRQRAQRFLEKIGAG